jgi:hypothetical protein
LTFAISQGSCWAVESIADDVPIRAEWGFGAASAHSETIYQQAYIRLRGFSGVVAAFALLAVGAPKQ